jgi:CheY-like chemotaxis protein
MANILVIDDSRSALALTGLILEEAGHRVIPCLSASGALKLAAETPVDLIVTDIYMPEKDGLEIIRDARKACPCIPIIAISGAGDATDMLNVARHLGAAYTLRKPFSKEQLLRAVTMALPPGGKTVLPSMSGASLD